MSARATFGQWLRDTREAHGYTQTGLAAELGMSRTYVVNLERTETWPQPATRARFHAVFGTSDEDIAAFGAAIRREHALPGRPPRISYEPTVRRGEAVPAEIVPALEGVPPGVADLMAEIRWTPETTSSVKMLLEGVVSRQRRLSDAAASPPGTPRPAPQRTPERT